MKQVAARTPEEIRTALSRIVEHVRADGLIAYPTETVYGFGGALSQRAAERLRSLKRRDAEKPFLILVAKPDDLPDMVWSAAARSIARLFWPGPLTLALPASPGTLPDVVGPDGLVALRASPHPFVRALVDAAGPITSTSANVPRTPPARDAAGAERALRELGADDVLIVDGGLLPESPPSTILAVEGSRARLLREGAITRRQLLEQLAGTGIDVD